MPFDLDALLPECLLAVGVVLALVGGRYAGWLVLFVSAGAAALAGWQWAVPADRSLFDGLLALDGLARFGRLFLVVAATLTCLLALLTGLDRRPLAALLAAALGLMLVTASGHWQVAVAAAAVAVAAGCFLLDGAPEWAGFLSVAVPAAVVIALARFASPLPVLAAVAILLATVGNLTAFREPNAQRLLGFATLGQVALLAMAVATRTADGLAAAQVGLVALGVANLGAFGVLAFVRRAVGSTDLRDLRGLIRRAPALAVLLTLFLLSLLGAPPFVGWFAKAQLLGALADATRTHPEQAGWMSALVIAAVVNFVLAAVAYLGLVRTLILEQRAEDLEEAEPQAVAEPAAALAYAGVLVVGLVLFLGEPGASAPGGHVSIAATDLRGLTPPARQE